MVKRPVSIDLLAVLTDKQVKAKFKVETISKLLLDRKLSVVDLIKLAKVSKDSEKGTCIEAIEFATRAKPEIHHTLLGIELKVGRRRMLCPDLATARYLAVFARLGCHQVAIPYDITKISQVADELERSWHRMLLLSDKLAADRSSAFRARLRRALIAKVQAEIEQAGAGARIPEFN